MAAEREGLVAGKRLRVNNLRGSSALAYEPDVILLMNDKYDVVARHHLVFDVGNAERFRSWAVMTIEKNRSGLDKIDLEFRSTSSRAASRPRATWWPSSSSTSGSSSSSRQLAGGRPRRGTPTACEPADVDVDRRREQRPGLRAQRGEHG